MVAVTNDLLTELKNVTRTRQEIMMIAPAADAAEVRFLVPVTRDTSVPGFPSSYPYEYHCVPEVTGPWCYQLKCMTFMCSRIDLVAFRNSSKPKTNQIISMFNSSDRNANRVWCSG